MAHNVEGDLHKPTVMQLPCINEDSESLPVPAEIQLKPTTSKKRAVRNAFIVGFSYFLYFTGFWTLSSLQSTMNAKGGIGVDSQAVIYLCSMVSCFFPELLIGKLGTKFTYVIAIVFSLPYLAANFSLRWDTMIISAVLYGMASGPLNSALNCYIDEMAVRFGASSDESQEYIGAIFFGTFMFFSEFTNAVGNSVVYGVLLKGYHPPPQNVSIPTECGIHFDPKAHGNNTNLDPPSDHDRYMISGIFLLLGLLAVVMALFLDPLRNDMKEVKGCRSVSLKIIGAAKHLRNPHQLLLLPLTIYIGMEGVLYSAEITQAFIACSWGVHHVGFVTICFGVCGALMAILVGPLVKCVSQMSVIILAALINVVTCALLFVWQPSPDAPVAYFAFAGVWGMTDAIWWSQVAALYGLMFPNDREAAFSNFFFWSFLGYFMSYSYANYFTVAVKINIMLVFLIVGITLYVIGQVKIKCFSNRSCYVTIDEPE